MILEETSEIGGRFAVDINMSTLDFDWVLYNGMDITRRVEGTWMETAIWNFFNDRYELEQMQADYFNEMRSSFAMLSR